MIAVVLARLKRGRVPAAASGAAPSFFVVLSMCLASSMLFKLLLFRRGERAMFQRALYRFYNRNAKEFGRKTERFFCHRPSALRKRT